MFMAGMSVSLFARLALATHTTLYTPCGCCCRYLVAVTVCWCRLALRLRSVLVIQPVDRRNESSTRFFCGLICRWVLLPSDTWLLRTFT